MQITGDGRHMTIFKHYNQEYRHEDNLTRALACCLTRSSQAFALTKAVLGLFANKLVAKTEQWQELAAVLDAPFSVDISLQESVPDCTRETEECVRDVVVFLTPEGKVPGVGTTEEPTSTKAIADVLMTVTGPEETTLAFWVEVKKAGEVADAQAQKYVDKLEDPPVIEIPWKEIFKLIIDIPERLLTADSILTDFLEILAEFPRLTGFLGITEDDLQSPGSNRLATKMRQLTAELCAPREGEDFPDIQDSFGPYRRNDSTDIDLYLPESEQVDQIGNVGMAVWKAGTFCTKLVVGDFKYKKENKPKNAEYKTHKGAYNLKQNWKDRKAAVKRAWKNLEAPEKPLRVSLKVRVRRVQYIHHYKVFGRSPATFRDLCEAVNQLDKLQPGDKGRPIDQPCFEQIAELLARFSDEGEGNDYSDWKADQENLTSGYRYVTGSLLITQDLGAYHSMSADEQVSLLAERVAGISDLLRAMSGTPTRHL